MKIYFAEKVGFSLSLITAAVLFSASGCTRIETGEVGLRVGFDKQVATQELQPGSFNQTIIGDVLQFPVRDIALNLDDVKPQTQDNSTLADMDVTVIYSISPSAVSELYTTKSKAFHLPDNDGNILLMYNYLTTVARSAAYKAVAKHDALKTVSERAAIEADMVQKIIEELKAEKLGTGTLDMALTITKVQVRNVQPAQNIIDSANAVITSQNNLRAKNVEVEIAQKEAERLSMLSKNTQNIQYMNAKALEDIAIGVREGKVHTVVIPYDFKGIVNAGKQ